jgi:hypothetical protein
MKVVIHMKSLSRMKNREGDISESVRALRREDLKDIYKLMMRCPTEEKYRLAAEHCWYLIAFLCMMRIDELRDCLEWKDIEFLPGQTKTMTIHLRRRKNDQLNKRETKFELERNNNPGEEYLCPIRALLRYVQIVRKCVYDCEPAGPDGARPVKLYLTGPFMRAVDDKGYLLSRPPSYNHFLKRFRFNMSRIGRPGHLYGLHSFRRGGAQYYTQFISGKKWSLTKLCDWGGWSRQTLQSIARYITGALDGPSVMGSFFRGNNNLTLEKMQESSE